MGGKEEEREIGKEGEREEGRGRKTRSNNVHLRGHAKMNMSTQVYINSTSSTPLSSHDGSSSSEIRRGL